MPEQFKKKKKNLVQHAFPVRAAQLCTLQLKSHIPELCRGVQAFMVSCLVGWLSAVFTSAPQEGVCGHLTSDI